MSFRAEQAGLSLQRSFLERVGDGRRVSKSNGKLYWYGSGDDILAETDASGNTQNEYIFFGGKRVAVLPAGGNPSYYGEDLLGRRVQGFLCVLLAVNC